MAVWYSRVDRERMERGLPPREHSTLTVEDYGDLIEFALREAVERSPAKDLVGAVRLDDLGGTSAGATREAVDANGKPTGKYDIRINWGSEVREKVADPENGPAYVAQLVTSAFHEVRHVEQRAMQFGSLPIADRLDMEVVTQMTVNDLYRSAYWRGYRNTVTEVDADVEGVEGALAFFDGHLEIKSRYGFDFRKEVMRIDEYGVLRDGYRLTKAVPEELAAAMEAYRDGVYDDPWKAVRDGHEPSVFLMGSVERTLMERLESVHGTTWSDLEKMDNDERNVLLIQNAIEAIDDPDVDLGRDMSAYREGPVMVGRLDEAVRDENAMRSLVQSPGAAAPEEAWRQFKGEAFSEQAAPAAFGSGRTLGRDGRQVSIPGGYSATGMGLLGVSREKRLPARDGRRASDSRSDVYRATGKGRPEASEEDAGPSLDR